MRTAETTDAQRALAKRLRVDTSELCLLDDLSALVRAFVPEGGVVALAEPTDSAVTEAVAAAGARWLDVGRTAALQVHPDGWGFAMASDAVRLGWLLIPEEPTATIPSRRLFRLAEQRGVTVVIDERFSATPGAPATLSAAFIRLRALEWTPPNRPARFVAIAPAELLVPLRRLARTRGPLTVPPRRVAFARDEPLPLPSEAVIIGRTPVATCFRLPGVPSVEVGARIGLPNAGGRHWSWRDAARVWEWDRAELERRGG